MITMSRIVVLVGSRDLGQAEEAFNSLITKINNDLRTKYGGKVVIEAEPYRRGVVEVIVTAPNNTTAESFFAGFVERFAEVQEEAVQQSGMDNLVTHVKFPDYVLMLLQENPKRTFTAEEIADRCSISLMYVRNILKKLRDEKKVIVVDSPYGKSRGRPKLFYQAAP